MTTDDGTGEPITAAEAPTRPDGLEHWLQDLRADLSNDPPGWLEPDDAGNRGVRNDAAHEPGMPPTAEHEPPAAETTGRHRAQH